jgi:superfamily II helicase
MSQSEKIGPFTITNYNPWTCHFFLLKHLQLSADKTDKKVFSYEEIIESTGKVAEAEAKELGEEMKERDTDGLESILKKLESQGYVLVDDGSVELTNMGYNVSKNLLKIEKLEKYF